MSAPDSNATIGGVGAIFVTGAFAIVATGAVLLMASGYGFRMEPIDWVLLGLVLAVTIGGGIALARFVRRHPNAIGEARFDTSHPDDPPARPTPPASSARRAESRR